MSIAVFDSGLGGLTVLNALVHSLPDESYVYLGDCARLPYGSKSQKTIRRYLTQNIDFLKERNVEALVVACNSASTALEVEDDFGLPVYNVITPGAKAAVAMTENKKVGIIGTHATVEKKAYVRALQDLDPNLEIYSQACPLFVPLVEEGWQDDPLTNLIVHRYVAPLGQSGIDTLILGCTHYPLLKLSIRKVLGAGVNIVDSAEVIAEQVKSDLESGIFKKGSSDAPKIEILSTDKNARFESLAQKIMAPLEVELLAVDL